MALAGTEAASDADILLEFISKGRGEKTVRYNYQGEMSEFTAPLETAANEENAAHALASCF